MLDAWLRAFAFTQLVEAPIYRRAARVSWLHSLAPSTLTHPIVWFVFPALLGDDASRYIAMVIAAELFAFAFEALYLRVVPKVPVKRAFVLSFAANGASLTLGLLSRRLFGTP